MSAEIITFPRPFRPSREQRREAFIDEMVRIMFKDDKRDPKVIREDAAALVADAMATVRARHERGEG
jgi:hypothetical protein